MNRSRTASIVISMDFTKLKKPELVTYIDFLLKHIRYCDSLWYVFAENKLGSQTADQLNEDVWTVMGKIAARDIVSKFNVLNKGLDGFIEVQKYYYWAILTGYNIEKNDNHLIITVPHCPPQEARLKKGMGEYNCKAMHQREFEAMAREIDERLKVECIFAPLDPHPAETFCKWKITCSPLEKSR